MTTVTNAKRLLIELQSEIIQLEIENSTLREKIKQIELSKVSTSDLVVKSVDWVELESGKRFLTKKDLGKYIGIAATTISNQMSKGVFPIRPKKMGRAVRFDMREVLDYLDTNIPFWERDKESKEKR